MRKTKQVALPWESLTWEELGAKIENEGFGYFFMDYTSPEKFTDDGLRALVVRFRDAADDLADYLEQKGAGQGQ